MADSAPALGCRRRVTWPVDSGSREVPSSVVLAYEQLTSEGYLESARGGGTFVARDLPDDWFTPEPAVPVQSSETQKVLAYLDRRLDDRRVSRAGLAAGIETLPLSKYTLGDCDRGGLLLGFAAVSASRSRRAVGLLREVLARSRPCA